MWRVDVRGEKNGRARLTAAQVVDIRARLRAGELLRDVAGRFGISVTHACAIGNGRRWGPSWWQTC